MMKINDETKADLIIEMLTEISVQNRVLAEMMLPLYCDAKGIDTDTARRGLNQFFAAKKDVRQQHIFAEHGRITIEDILGKTDQS